METKIEYWEIMSWDGGDRHFSTDAKFTSEEEAKKFLGNNVYDKIKHHKFYIYDTVDDYDPMEKIRQKALSKLSEKEKEALGLN